MSPGMMHVGMMYVGMMYVGRTYVGMMYIGMMYVGMMYVGMMHVGMMYVCMMYVGLMYVGMMHVGMIFVGMMYVSMMYVGMMNVSMMYVGMLARDASGRFARLGQTVPTAGHVTGQHDEGAAEASEANTGSAGQDAMPVKQQGVDSDEEGKMQVDQQESDLITSERQGQVSRIFDK